ncbi:penicillin-binding protein activator LpoB [Sphingomonas sp.]|uniref:penicillin-binding protein activator LpoB n=1 Tax=Sphingomonas sp. TaxID=28214 RepID=UPI002ED82B3B
MLATLVAAATGVPLEARKSDRATTTRTLDPSSQGIVSGVGIEGADIVAMADQMMRDMLATSALAGRAVAPQIIVDAEYFSNESSQRINKNIITDRLRVSLNRASQGRFVFVARHRADMVEQERALKREGVVDVGTTGMTRAQAGGDFRLSGNITSLDQRNNATGMVQRFTQITFEMVDLERGTVVWSNTYDVARASADDIIYR